MTTRLFKIYSTSLFFCRQFLSLGLESTQDNSGVWYCWDGWLDWMYDSCDIAWGCLSFGKGMTSNCVHYFCLRSVELRTQKLKPDLVRTQSLNVLPLEPGVGQYIAIHTTLTARDFFLLISTFPVHSPDFFPKPLPFFYVLAVASTWFLCRPADYNRSPYRRQVLRLSASGI